MTKTNFYRAFRRICFELSIKLYQQIKSYKILVSSSAHKHWRGDSIYNSRFNLLWRLSTLDTKAWLPTWTGHICVTTVASHYRSCTVQFWEIWLYWDQIEGQLAMHRIKYESAKNDVSIMFWDKILGLFDPKTKLIRILIRHVSG